MKTDLLYFDHAATTPIAPEVLLYFTDLLREGIGNSSSAHSVGAKAQALLNQARETVSAKLGCEPSEIVFTSGGTEGNNWILQRVVGDATPSLAKRGLKPHILTSAIEHSSIMNTAEWLEQSGMAEWDEVPATSDGLIDPAVLSQMIKPNTVLVSILHGNNEIGTIQNLNQLGEVCRTKQVLFHSDSCQTFCHEPFSVRDLPVDFMTLSGHKIRAPKGVGAVFMRKSIEITGLMMGGKQERGLRPGTTSVELICAFAKATEVWTADAIGKTHDAREYAIKRLKEKIPGLRINGVAGTNQSAPTLCHVLSFTVPGIHSKDLHRELSFNGVACSTGAACGTGKSDSSAVLLGLGRAPQDAHQIRISFSPTSDRQMVDLFIERLLVSMKGAS